MVVMLVLCTCTTCCVKDCSEFHTTPFLPVLENKIKLAPNGFSDPEVFMIREQSSSIFAPNYGTFRQQQQRR
jgi:hypothetical protein